MDIVEKMKNWDSWEAMKKDLRPYLDEVCARGKNKDDSIIQDYYILKLLAETKVRVEFSKAIDELLASYAPDDKAYKNVVADIMKLHRYSDKLYHVLDAHPRLIENERRGIRYDWKKQGWEEQNAIKTQASENLVMMEDSGMEEYLKAKCDELANLRAKLAPNQVRQQEILNFRMMIYNVRDYVRCQRIFHQALPELHRKHKERVQNIWPKNNSCSSTLVKKKHASSEDNICKAERTIFARPKKPKLVEC